VQRQHADDLLAIDVLRYDRAPVVDEHVSRKVQSSLLITRRIHGDPVHMYSYVRSPKIIITVCHSESISKRVSNVFFRSQRKCILDTPISRDEREEWRILRDK
jgi:hypothetical protein